MHACTATHSPPTFCRAQVLLGTNMLIAIMAKTFDSIYEEQRAALLT